jgi:hypothetical protein
MEAARMSIRVAEVAKLAAAVLPERRVRFARNAEHLALQEERLL